MVPTGCQAVVQGTVTQSAHQPCKLGVGPLSTEGKLPKVKHGGGRAGLELGVPVNFPWGAILVHRLWKLSNGLLLGLQGNGVLTGPW